MSDSAQASPYAPLSLGTSSTDSPASRSESSLIAGIQVVRYDWKVTNRQPRSLVAGGAGFVGSHLCDRLLVEGHAVVALDNLITGRVNNVDHLRGKSTFELIEADVCQPLDIPAPFDFVWHLASPASPRDYLTHPMTTLLVGSHGTQNLLEIAKRDGAQFLVTSTSECYGDPLEHPQTETYWGNVNPIGVRSVYDESKRYAEAMTMAYHRYEGVETHIARLFNTFGPRMKLNDGRVVPAFLDQALRGKPLSVFGRGEQTRSFCYVDDTVEGLYRLMQSSEREPVNIGNPTEMTILEFAEYITKLVGSSSVIEFQPLPEDDPKKRQPDISKAKRILDWEPKVSLEDGLRRTAEYYVKNEHAPALPPRDVPSQEVAV